MSTNFFNNLKTKLLTLLLALCLVSTCVFGLIACDKDNEDEKDPTYTFTQTTTETSSQENNFNFSEEINLETDTFPKNATSWSVSVDNSAVSSSVNSGVVSTSEEGWKKVVSSLSEDTEFLDYVKTKNSVSSNDDAKALINKNDYFTAPTRSGATDDYVYMLNNYREKTYVGVGTAQRLVSSSTLTLDKNSYYKVSVWVNTQNLDGTNLDGFGANIRLVGTLNTNSVADYAIENIETNGVWEQYSIYVKSDDTYTCTINLVLGLGYGNGASNLTKNYVEGTVYFDEISIDKVKAEDVPNDVTEKNIVSYDASQRISVINAKTSIYEMNFDAMLEDEGFFTEVAYNAPSNDDELDALFTTGLNDATVTSKTICEKEGVTSTIDVNDEITEYPEFILENASATYKLPTTATLNGGEYTIVNFKIKNDLSNFGSTEITIDVWDIYDNDNVRVKRPAVATFSTPSEDFVDCTLYIKNNFKNTDDTSDDRTFEIDVVMGPTKVAEIERATDFASGKVSIKDLRYVTRKIEDVKDDKIAKLFTSTPSATVSLYAGYGADFDENAEKKTYSLNEAPGSIGTIKNYPSNPAGYDGVVANHSYVINSKDAVTAINTRSGKDGTAGLINSENIDTAEYGIDITKLGNPEKPIQPLMINNVSADSYGFVSKNVTTLAASAVASFTVKVRVLDGAKAFIYLVNAEKSSKDVLSFEDFKVNTDVVKGVAAHTEVKGDERLFAIEVTENLCDDNGWATVSFYIVNGKDEKQVRLELWNGSRTGDVKSKGLVFFDEVNVTTSSAFTKSEKWNETFSVSGNPLYDQTFASYDDGELFAYKRTLTEDEANFNAEYPDKAVEYFTTYVWAKNSLSVFADYSTLDSTRVITNPYDSIEEEEEEATGCAAKTDPSTFWLSFSTIILIVALALALIALIVKKIVRRRKANASDAKSHFKVTSRIKKKATESKPETKEEVKDETTEVVEETEVKEDETSDVVEETENVENTETTTETESVETTEETDGYVYGDVIEDFTIENPENVENTETTTENDENK